VIKFITVRIDEEEKRLAKVKALRAAPKRSATPIAARSGSGAAVRSAVAAPVEAAEQPAAV
jgi:small subunit ribosomal protein S6